VQELHGLPLSHLLIGIIPRGQASQGCSGAYGFFIATFMSAAIPTSRIIATSAIKAIGSALNMFALYYIVWCVGGGSRHAGPRFGGRGRIAGRRSLFGESRLMEGNCNSVVLRN
jgi:hypothetical protein